MNEKTVKADSKSEAGQYTPTAPRKKPTGVVIIGGNFQGLGFLRSLARHGIPTYLVDEGLCIGRFSRDTKKFFRCPDANHEAAFSKFLTDLAKTEDVKGWIIYPNDDETVRFLAQNKEALEEYYRISTPSWDVVKYTYDKNLTYKMAEKCGIPIPRTVCPTSPDELEQLNIEFPVIIKPSIKEPFYSRLKRKAILIRDRKKLRNEYIKALMKIEPSQKLLVQELIPGSASNLFSVGSLFKNGEFLGKVVAHRLRQHPMDLGHATTFAETVDIPEMEELAIKILKEMNYRGLSEVEFMMDPRDKKYKLLEINARIWGWHSLAIHAGVDLPYLSYLDIMGEKVKQDGFQKGVKWMRLTTDIPTVTKEILLGRMKLGDYLRSLKGKKYDAVLSMRDLLPFIIELMMLPYLWKKKGF